MTNIANRWGINAYPENIGVLRFGRRSTETTIHPSKSTGKGGEPRRNVIDHSATTIEHRTDTAAASSKVETLVRWRPFGVEQILRPKINRAGELELLEREAPT